MHARDFVQPGEQLLVLLTNGHLLTFNNDGTGTSGNWKMDANRKINRILIYLRDDTNNTNRLYIATYNHAEKVEDGRYCIYFEHCQYVGKTEQNWSEFAGEGQNPIRYF